MTAKHTEKTAADLTVSEQRAVQHDAAKEVAKEAAKAAIERDTGTASEVDPNAGRFYGHDEIMQWEPLLDLSPEAFSDRISEGADHPIPENKIYGLLALERNGKNRTPYVQAMMKRLDLKREELPGGGPGYTNDVTPTTKLK